MICSEQVPGEVPARPRPPATNATEEGTAKAALWLFLAGLAVAVAAGAVWGVLRLREELLLANDAYLLKRPPEIHNYGGLIKDEEVLRYLGLTEHDLEKSKVNLYSIDLVARRRDFLENHPSITEFKMERLLPDRLVITIGERVPVARIGRRRSFAVDADGFVFEIPPHAEDRSESLPRLFSERFAESKPGTFIAEADHVALDILRIASLTDSHAALSYAIAEIDLSGDLYVNLTTTGNIAIRIPRELLETPTDIEHCLRNASHTIATQRVDPGRTLIVNGNNTVTMQ